MKIGNVEYELKETKALWVLATVGKKITVEYKFPKDSYPTVDDAIKELTEMTES